MSVVLSASKRPVNSSKSTTCPVTGWAISTSIDLSPEAGLDAEPQPAAPNSMLQMVPSHRKRPPKSISAAFLFIMSRAAEVPVANKFDFIGGLRRKCSQGRHAQIETDRSV